MSVSRKTVRSRSRTAMARSRPLVRSRSLTFPIRRAWRALGVTYSESPRPRVRSRSLHLFLGPQGVEPLAKGAPSHPGRRPIRAPHRLDLAATLIEQRSAPFDPAEYHDRYADALRKLIDRKAKSKSKSAILEDAEEPAAKSGSNVIDLMAALKKSVGDAAPAAAKPKKPARKRA